MENKENIIKDTYEYLKNQYEAHERLGDKEAEYLKTAKMLVGAFKQVEWERDIAILQLKELGYSLGEKVREEDAHNKEYKDAINDIRFQLDIGEYDPPQTVLDCIENVLYELDKKCGKTEDAEEDKEI